VPWTIDYLRSVQRSVRKLDPQTRLRIRHFLEQRLVGLDGPRQVGEALQGTKLGDFWRYRVGDYRIVCELQDQKLVVLVIEIAHRRDVYR